SVSAEFPRVAIALVEDSQEEGVPYFVALQQEDAKSPYTTWGWAQQAVGVDMPMVPDAAVGSEQVTPDSEGLVMTPAKALELFASVLSLGDAEDPDDLLAPNPFQTATHERIQTERKELNAGVEKDEAATIHESFSVKDDEFVGLRTDDGGAIVLGTLLSTRKVSIKDGATMRYAEDNKYTKGIGKKGVTSAYTRKYGSRGDDQYTQAIGTLEFTPAYIRKYGTHLALFIPSEDAGGQVQPIGATQTALDASGTCAGPHRAAPGGLPRLGPSRSHRRSSPVTDPYGIIDLAALKQPAGGESGGAGSAGTPSAHEVAVTEQGLEQLIADSQSIPTLLLVTSARVPEADQFLSGLRRGVDAQGGAVRLGIVDADTQQRVAGAL